MAIAAAGPSIALACFFREPGRLGHFVVQLGVVVKSSLISPP